MENFLPEKLKTLALRCPVPLYVVGGTCRDVLSGRAQPPFDWDICAPCDAESLCRAAEESGFAVEAVYPNTGTVKLTADGNRFEYTSFRSDEYVRGKHRPERVYFTEDIGQDARRRDFKCNAVYYDIRSRSYVDPLGGREDIAAGRLTTVVSPEKVFGEDGLRLMRLCRIAAQTGWEPSAACMEGARRNAALVADISPERIWSELSLILRADARYGVPRAHYRGLKLMKETGCLPYILPELAAGDGLAQRSDYHSHDVLEHSLRCALYAPPEIRLAALLHDVGKPVCMKERGSAAGHETVGAEIAEAVCRRLRVPVKLTRETVRLTQLHMYDVDGAAREGKVRKFIVRNYDVLQKLLLLKQADYSACKDDTAPSPVVVKWKNIWAAMEREGVPFTLRRLALRGDDLAKAGVRPEEIGNVLKLLLEECALNARLNNRETLLRLALAVCGGSGNPRGR